MSIPNSRIADLILKVREVSPLVHNITNYVVMNNSANALLAIGASPIMSHAKEEVEDMVSICSALVLNIGTLDSTTVEAMFMAQRRANELGIAVVLDPVGAGATPYRNTVLKEILNNGRVDFIRGNASEIISLDGIEVKSKGVDSTSSSLDSLESAKSLSERTGAVVCVSGEIDIIVCDKQIGYVDNGSKLMEKVTGLGCSATAILGAFAGLKEERFESAMAATVLIALCGEMAAERCEGPGTLQLHLLDKLYNITKEELLSRIKTK